MGAIKYSQNFDTRFAATEVANAPAIIPLKKFLYPPFTPPDLSLFLLIQMGAKKMDRE